MKNAILKMTLLIIVVMSLRSQALAQLSKGNRLIGGDFNATSRSSKSNLSVEESKHFSFSISPLIGLLTGANVAWYLQIPIAYATDKLTNSSRIITTTETFYTGVTLGHRRYISLSEKFYFSVDGQLGYSNFSNGAALHTFQFGLVPQVNFFPSRHWQFGLNFSGPRVYYSSGTSGNFRENVFGFTNDMSASNWKLGITFFTN